MVKPDSIKTRINILEKYLITLDGYKAYLKKEIFKEKKLHEELGKLLYLTAEEAIYLAKDIIVFKNYRKPATAREGFEILEEEYFIDTELCRELVKMNGWKKFTHNERIDFGTDNLLYELVIDDVESIKELIVRVKDELNF